MENSSVPERDAPARAADSACPAELEALRVAVLRCCLDGDLSFLWANSSFFSKIGYSKEEFSHSFSSLRQYYAAFLEDFASIRAVLTQGETGGGSGIELIVRLPLRGGGFSWVQLCGTVRGDPAVGGPAFQAELTGVDALMAEKAEQSRLYRQKLQYFHWMLDAYEGNVYVSDMETNEILYLNPSACKVLRGPPGKFLGKKCYEVILGRTTPCPFCASRKLTEDDFYQWEFSNPSIKRAFLIRSRLLEWEGRRARIELSYDMFSAEYKLAQKDRERAALIRSVPGGFVRIDARDRRTVLWHSGAFLPMLGYTKEQFEEELHSQCTYIHSEDLARTTDIMELSRQTGESTVAEGRIVTRGGAIKILTMTYSYISGENSWDGIPSFYSVGIDMTKAREEQFRQRLALEEACNAARIANDAKTNFLSSMSHDIRTPMNAIIGMSVIAQANLHSPEKVQNCLGKINSASRHLLGLINEVLDMSKIESGKIDLLAERVSLPDLIEDVAEVFRPLTVEKGQTFQINADFVRHEMVLTDENRLREVLMNLLSNAVKYTPEGGAIDLRIREMPSSAPNRGQYEFIVADNGIGMSEEFIPHLFEPFSRAESSGSNRIQGTGLGMSITQNIIRIMNGTIEVKSTPGGGSRFIVALPFELCGEERGGGRLPGRSVLVVDDDPDVCESASQLLRELGMQSGWALSGREAVDRATAAHAVGDDFFSVILDWKMPGMDGLETVKGLREALGADVPIIIVSAHDYSQIEDDFRLAGANAFISKPLFKSKMERTLLQFCPQTQADRAAPPAQPDRLQLAGKQILLVEDNLLNREIAAELLQMEGLFVTTAENGRIAVEIFQNSAPGAYHCILMDIQMPVMDGYQATETIRAMDRPDARTIPILALTANAFASDIGRAHNAGMDDHISKPIDLALLMETLRRWIG